MFDDTIMAEVLKLTLVEIKEAYETMLAKYGKSDEEVRLYKFVIEHYNYMV
jgi:hypothetical protein